MIVGKLKKNLNLLRNMTGDFKKVVDCILNTDFSSKAYGHWFKSSIAHHKALNGPLSVVQRGLEGAFYWVSREW